MWSIAQLRKKKETKRKNEKTKKKENTGISTYSTKLTAIVDVFLADCTTTYHNKYG